MEQEINSQDNLIKEVSMPLYQAKGWMKFLGIMMIIAGALYAITIIGLIFAWLPIWMGIILYQAGSSSEQAYYDGDKYSLIKSLTQLKLYFTITGIMALIGIVMMVIMFIVIIAGGFAFSELLDSDEFRYNF
jgi:hypothetical protein